MSARKSSALPAITLVLGGVRSGKSAYAEGLVESHVADHVADPGVVGGGGIYLATGSAGDAEMAERIRRHQARRGEAWTTVEEPLDLIGALRAHAAPWRPILVDCLTLWLSNLFDAGRRPGPEIAALATGLLTVAGPVVLVSGEVGMGIVPDNALARAYMDAAGEMNQAVAAAADRVVLVTAGLPREIKTREIKSRDIKARGLKDKKA